MALVPIGVGGVNGALETTVVQGDVPLLLPVRLLKALNVTIDLKGLYMKLQDHGVVVPLHEMPSGHVTVNILSFSAGRFHVPPQAGRQEEFELENACFATTAMPAQREQGFQFGRVPKDAHRVHQPPMASLLQKAKALVTDPTPMEVGHHVANPRVPLRNWRVVLDKIGVLLTLAALQDATAEAWCLDLASPRSGAAVNGDHGGLLRRGDPHRQSFAASAEQEPSDYIGKCMHPPEGKLEGWWKRLDLIPRMPSVPFQVGPYRKGSGHPQDAQRRPLEHNHPAGQEGGHYTRDTDTGIASRSEDSDEKRGPDQRKPGDTTDVAGRRAIATDPPRPSPRDGHAGADHDAANEERASRQHHPPVAVDGGSNAADGGGDQEVQRGKSRARHSPGEAHADDPASPGQAGGGPRPKGQFEALSTSQGPNDLSVRQTSRGLGCEKGRPAEGPDVLEVRATKVRSLCMDPGGGPGGHRGCEDRGFILEPKAVQESEEGGPCGGAGSGFISTMSELVTGFHPEQQGRRGEGAHHPDRRGLSGDTQWAKCATRRAIRWASKARDGKDPHFIVEKSYWILSQGRMGRDAE